MHFDTVYVCKLGYEYEYRVRNIIRKDEVLGAIASDYYLISVHEETEIVIGLHQEDERSVGVKKLRKYLDFGIVVMQLEGENYTTIDSTKKNLMDRDCQLEITLNPGNYIIIPISSGSSFNPVKKSSLNSPLLTETGSMHPIFQSTVRDIFRRSDANMNQVISCDEFLELS